MEELKAIGTYQEFKKALDAELYNQAEGFVRTGYLLKVARDTDILRESGYATVAEFAHAEYGLTKDVVSRYIAINDRYSEGGYSEKLQAQYQGYGVAKLQDMLTLPDAIIEVMSPEMTRKEIQEVKREYKEEETNPMASLMEAQKTEQADMTVLQKAMHQYLYDNRAEFTKGFDAAMRAETEKEEAVNGILDALAPSGVGIKTVRIQGIGRVMISFRGKDAEIEVLNVRTQERKSYSWQQFIEELRMVFALEAGESAIEAWARIYKEAYEEKNAEVVPVQQKSSAAPVKKESKTVKAPKKTEWKSSYKVGQQVKVLANDHIGELKEKREKPGVWKVQFATYVADMHEAQFTEYMAEQDAEEQVPGQTSIEEDFKEFLPEPTEETVNSAEIAEGTPIDSQPASGNEETEKLKQEIRNTILLMNTLAKQEDWKRLIEEAKKVQRCAEQMLELKGGGEVE